MEEKLDSVTADMENLKQVPPQRMAQPPGVGNSDMVHSTQQAQSAASSGDAGNNVAISMDVSWAERMELDNAAQRQLWQQFIVPNTSFTTAPHLDKTIVDECSKSTKTSDNTLSWI